MPTSPDPDPNAARWAWLREQTPAALRSPYLNCGWIGAMSRPVRAAVRDRLDLEVEYGGTTRAVQADRAAINERLRSAGARMLGCDPDELAITENTTDGVNIAVNGLDIRAGDRVVTSSVEHSSGLVPVYRLRDQLGADLVFAHVEAEDGPGSILERFDQAMGDHPRLVLLSEISFSTGGRLPVAEITRMAHERGGTVVIDGAQTAGHIPVRLHESGVDAYAVPSHKWLCGPGGAGLLYVRRDRIEDFEPVKVSGKYAAAYDFEGAFAPKRDAIAKFELSTMSAPALAGMAAAAEQYLESGPEAVWDRVRWLNREAERLFTGLPRVRVAGATGEATRSGLFLFGVAGIDPAHLAYYLQAAGGVVCRSVRQMDAVRLSLHVYNTIQDIERAAEFTERAAVDGIPAEILEAARAAAGPEA